MYACAQPNVLGTQTVYAYVDDKIKICSMLLKYCFHMLYHYACTEASVCTYMYFELEDILVSCMHGHEACTLHS